MSVEAEELAVGVIGTGFVARTHHLPALARLGGIRVVALADPDPAARGRAHALAPDAAALEDFRPLLDTPGLGAVAVLTPLPEHAPVIVEALRRGLAVFTEKPLALTLDEAAEISAAQRQSGSLLGVGFVFRRHRLIAQALHLIEEGALGQVRAIASTMTGDSLGNPERANEWRSRPEQGGGVLYELGSHQFDLWALLGGAPVAEIECTAPPQLGSAAVAARLGNDVVATGAFSDEAGRNHQVTVYGSAATLELRLDRYDGLELFPASRLPGDPGVRLRRAAKSLRSFPSMVASHRAGGDLARAFEAEWRDFARAVTTGCDFSPGLDEGIASLEAVRAATESAGSGAAVAIGQSELEASGR